MHITKLGSNTAGVRQVLKHIDRTRGENARYGNELIDKGRTKDNMTLFSNKDVKAEQRWLVQVEKARAIHEKTTGKAARSDAVTLVSAVIQLPHEYCTRSVKDGREYWIPNDMAAARSFFKAAADCTLKHFGVENGMVTYASVHYDETTPHIHVGWVPLQDGRLNAKRQVCRSHLQTYHDSVDRVLREKLAWYHGGLVAEEPTERLKARDNVRMHELRKVERSRQKAADELSQAHAELLQEKQQVADARNELSRLHQMADGPKTKLSRRKRERISEGKSVRLSAEEARAVAADILDGEHGRDLDARRTRAIVQEAAAQDAQRKYEECRRIEQMQLDNRLARMQAWEKMLQAADDALKAKADELQKVEQGKDAIVSRAAELLGDRVPLHDWQDGLSRFVKEYTRPANVPETPEFDMKAFVYQQLQESMRRNARKPPTHQQEREM